VTCTRACVRACAYARADAHVRVRVHVCVCVCVCMRSCACACACMQACMRVRVEECVCSMCSCGRRMKRVLRVECVCVPQGGSAGDRRRPCPGPAPPTAHPPCQPSRAWAPATPAHRAGPAHVGVLVGLPGLLVPPAALPLRLLTRGQGLQGNGVEGVAVG